MIGVGIFQKSHLKLSRHIKRRPSLKKGQKKHHKQKSQNKHIFNGGRDVLPHRQDDHDTKGEMLFGYRPQAQCAGTNAKSRTCPSTVLGCAFLLHHRPAYLPNWLLVMFSAGLLYRWRWYDVDTSRGGGVDGDCWVELPTGGVGGTSYQGVRGTFHRGLGSH